MSGFTIPTSGFRIAVVLEALQGLLYSSNHALVRQHVSKHRRVAWEWGKQMSPGGGEAREVR